MKPKTITMSGKKDVIVNVHQYNDGYCKVFINDIDMSDCITKAHIDYKYNIITISGTMRIDNLIMIDKDSRDNDSKNTNAIKSLNKLFAMMGKEATNLEQIKDQIKSILRELVE